MKQRVTLLHPEYTYIDGSGLNATHGRELVGKPALEKRVTASLSELPPELRNLPLWSNTHELHIRWVSSEYHEPPTTFASRLPSGLHVFFTPSARNESYNPCLLLTYLFDRDMRCSSPAESFSRPPILSERFSASSAYQFYQPLPRIFRFQLSMGLFFCTSAENSTSNVSRDASSEHNRTVSDLSRESTNTSAGYVHENLSARHKCMEHAVSLAYASYLDIDYDAISGSVTATAFWSSELARPAVERGSRVLVSDSDSLELGLFVPEKAEEAEELKIGGYVIMVEEDEEPSPVLFSFPSRHHPLPSSSPATFVASFLQPTGLHPNLELTLPRQHLLPPKDDGSCALHVYLTLPSALFLDRYQLSDPAYLASQNLIALRSLSGEQDLEAPDWVIKRWGSAALIELAHPANISSDQRNANWTVTIPTHLRYLRPQPNDTTPGYTTLDIPWPIMFWACEATEGLKMHTNPFDRVNLGYDGLFGPKTMFYHIPPSTSRGQVLVEKLTVPVLEPSWAGIVQWGTLFALLGGFLWVCWGLAKAAGVGELWTGRSSGRDEHDKKQ
ncbi:hypothetical protein BAUCODRAFT_147577 [Baudoinia panamericana UAMH 10762]|uniref:Protein PBN1 n=1 Tax=Baudoinia panamericana (strain UAMH 10762) TaxID=717646 RepID=M2N0R5_BAUPA|nr:uncharacterized protein BAUCODRAFT_147577 [Baudoinia panamericana UAMH 10762]EMC97508.1 hypothetical protein BAUCODRAFT_147577 [Baudoinia panamericana UAMH 10762]